jgi:hypothetical protein
MPHAATINSWYKEAMKATSLAVAANPELFQKNFNGKIIYKALQQAQKHIPVAIRKWPINIPYSSWACNTHAALSPSARDLAYRISHRTVQLKRRLCSFGTISDNRCALCLKSAETIEHLFKECQTTKIVRSFTEAITGIDISNTHFSPTLAIDASRPEDRDFYAICLSELNLAIWRARNFCNFESAAPDSAKILCTYKHALKSRILSDHLYLSPEDFCSRWCDRPIPITLSSSLKLLTVSHFARRDHYNYKSTIRDHLLISMAISTFYECCGQCLNCPEGWGLNPQLSA